MTVQPSQTPNGPERTAPARAGLGPAMDDRTFLFTDIEGSVRQWETAPERMSSSLELHDRLITEVIESEGGTVFKNLGDGLCGVFGSAFAALRAAAAIQSRLQAEEALANQLRVRVAVHTGPSLVRNGDYFGPALSVVARLIGSGHGGQALTTDSCLRAAAAPATEPPPTVDLGEHRFRDVSSPVRVYQLVVTGGPRSFPPLRSQATLDGNVPTQVRQLIGRERELAELTQAVRTSRLTTVVGFGGMGKTRIALEAAADLGGAYRDGVWLSELAAITRPEALAPAVGALFGQATPDTGLTTVASVVGALKSREALLVLDNCEHLVAEVAAFAEAVLQGCPRITLLCTSREPLNIDGERVLRLGPLEAAPSMELFLERVRTADPSFTFRPEDEAIGGEVCEQLEGLPLALELAAARVRTLGLHEVHARLADRLRLLEGGSRSRPERHKALRKTIDWSYALLEREEQAVFQQLSVFAGSFTLETAGAVVPDQRMGLLRIIPALIDKSLLNADIGDPVARYTMLESLREYARELLEESGGMEGTRLRFVAYYAGFAEKTQAILRGAGEERAVLMVDREFDNLREAFDGAFGAGDTAQALRMATATLEYSIWRMRYECGTWAERAIEMPGAAEHEGYVYACAMAAIYASQRGETANAAGLLQRASAVPGWAEAEGSWLVLFSLGLISAITGNGELAARYSTEMVRHARQEGEPAPLALALAQCAITMANVGDAVAWLPQTEEAIEIARRLQNPTLLAWSTWSKATALKESDPAEALRLSEEAAHHCAAVRNRYILGAIQTTQAFLRARDGAAPEAFDSIRGMLTFWQAHGDWGQLWPALRQATIVFGQFEQSEAVAIFLGAVAASPWAAGRTPADAERLSRARLAVEAAIGADSYRKAAEHGAAMHPDEVLALALTTIDRLKAGQRQGG